MASPGSLRVRRVSIHATLKQVADLCGVNDVRVHRWETEKSQPNEHHRIAWLAAVRRLEAVVARRVAEAKES